MSETMIAGRPPKGIYEVASGFNIVGFDTIVITYTGSDKATIDKVEFKSGSNTIGTLTQTQTSTADTWVRS
jgi:hypothetical protein